MVFGIPLLLLCAGCFNVAPTMFQRQSHRALLGVGYLPRGSPRRPFFDYRARAPARCLDSSPIVRIVCHAMQEKLRLLGRCRPLNECFVRGDAAHLYQTSSTNDASFTSAGAHSSIAKGLRDWCDTASVDIGAWAASLGKRANFLLHHEKMRA